MFLSRGDVCVSVCCACLLSTGGTETLHIKQPGIAVLSDVIESNEIQLSQQVLELQCCVEHWVCVCVLVCVTKKKKKDKEGKHPESVYQPQTCCSLSLYFYRCCHLDLLIKWFLGILMAFLRCSGDSKLWSLKVSTLTLPLQNLIPATFTAVSAQQETN